MNASLRRFWIQLTADRRRFGALCVVATVGLLLWARMIIVANMPRTAVAQPRGGETAAAPGAQSSDKSIGGAIAKDNRTDSTARSVVSVTLDRRADRDPFVISPEYFPKVKQASPLKPYPGKLPTEAAEDSSQKEARFSARLSELLGSVRLEAALGGGMAVIDGKPYRIGDRLPPVGDERIEFALVEIGQRSIVLEYQGRRFELEMSKPGK